MYPEWDTVTTMSSSAIRSSIVNSPWSPVISVRRSPPEGPPPLSSPPLLPFPPGGGRPRGGGGGGVVEARWGGARGGLTPPLELGARGRRVGRGADDLDHGVDVVDRD